MRWRSIGVMVLVAASWSLVAEAQGERGPRHRVAVVPLDFKGNVPEAAREELSRRLLEGLAAADFEVSGGAAIGSCRDDSCYPELARTLNVGYLVTGKVVEENKSYRISLDLLNGRTGGVVGANNEKCEICGIEEAAEKMGLAASALRARLEAHARAPARFIIRSRPSSARVAIDGQPMGGTPFDARLTGGEHRLTLSASGYHPLERNFTVVSGVDETLDYDLVPVPTAFPYKAAGWTAIAVGAVALAAGVWALVVDSDEISCAPAERDRDGDCPSLRNTRALGGVLVGAGAISATLGGVWLHFGTRGLPAQGQAGEARATVGVRGRF